jgi:hypothetical protein
MTDKATKLAKILGLLVSDHEGERVAAGLKANEILRGLGLQWHDVISIPGETPETEDWRAVAESLHGHADLTPREADFIENILNGTTLTEKQERWLGYIAERLKP